MARGGGRRFAALVTGRHRSSALSSIHVQTVCRVTKNGERGVGVLEQLVIGPHELTGLTGLCAGWAGNS